MESSKNDYLEINPVPLSRISGPVPKKLNNGHYSHAIEDPNPRNGQQLELKICNQPYKNYTSAKIK
jgi:hypothetical protein